MSQYHRLGHLQTITANVGQRVKKGDKVGTNGTGNGQWPAHLHYDCPKKELKSWTSYVFGWTKQEVADVYADPKQWRKLVAPWFDHFGWEYLELATYGTKKCYHPGEDLNGKGAGNADLGMIIYSPCDAEVVYAYLGTGSNAGWGQLLVLKELKTEQKEQEVDTTVEPVIPPSHEVISDNSNTQNNISISETPENEPEVIVDAGQVDTSSQKSSWQSFLGSLINFLTRLWHK